MTPPLTLAADQNSFARVQARSAELERSIAAAPESFRVLTGDRPTGPLHLGHYFGTLLNRVRLQQAGVEVLVLVADYQVITDRDRGEDLPEVVTELVLDQLAAGLDPERTTFFCHSAVPALNQLLLPLLSLVTVAELHRNPTVKAETAATGDRPMSGLMLTYPLHQAADILFCGANLVPVGRDQLPHLELTRTVARRFAHRYAPVFVQPEALLGDAPLLLGTDGTKMSKSRGNAVSLRADEDTTAQLFRRAVTDSERTITYEPQRRREVSGLVLLGALCRGEAPEDFAAAIGGGGATGLKTAVTEAVNERLRPLRARRAELAADPTIVREVLRRGNAVANEIAGHTLDRVRTAMGMRY
ncbi:tryptophan--tRNA ligase [Blastococcus goldschmidtiae]|uniref:Tryptophan--tRNA ligase n=1 Tax=Blastococcus goldschmidtiae TaxID=3075546 RepID=A0ABU2KCI8_9ACTN|nr:tryptophan--tRNA ligase [Blastococcus sp. DSM 46792]MDT0277895.1 tryptophan--tRNA ligase [Blastococcus sp. DSM 46792]